MTQPVLLSYDTKDLLKANVTSTEVITKGDLVGIASGYVYLIDAATNCSFFAGVALDSSADGETTPVAFTYKGVLEIDATTSSYNVGKGLTYTSTNTVATSIDDIMCWVAEDTSSASRIKVIFNAIAVKVQSAMTIFPKSTD